MASLYLTDAATLAADLAADRAVVDGAEARHAAQVARVRVGERLAIGDGAGVIAHGEVVASDPARVEIRVDRVERSAPASPVIRLAQALAKGDRDELAIQAATELGIDGVIPWAAARSVSRWQGPKVAKGEARWAGIVREAAKQAIRPTVPEVGALSTTRQLAALAGPDHTVLVLDPTAEQPLATIGAPATSQVTLVVGPEGGISPHELEELERAGAIRVRLGAEILRTSTAGPVALSVLRTRLGHWD